MQFESWAEFWSMGGYGFFVWLAFGVTFASLIILAIQSFAETGSLKKQIIDTKARKARIAAAQVKA